MKTHRAVTRQSIILVMVILMAVIAPMTGCDRQEKVLRIWQTETDKKAIEELNKTIQEFENVHPGVRVELESVAWSSLSNKLSVAMQAHNEPDVAHLEPFMVASLVRQNLLLPIDDVIDQIEKDNGDQIYEGVRNLQLFDGQRYGIAYAVGTTAWAYRQDVARRLHLPAPTTWGEYVNFARAMSQANAKLQVLLPGGDPFFIDQLFAELVANNGGRLFDGTTNRPMLTSKPVVETLEFLRKLAPYVDPGWQTQPYLDQFNRFARGEAGNVPVTYARAAKAIQNALGSQTSGNSPRPNPDYFAVMPQPVGPSYSGPSIATIDCEPYVIFRSAEERGNAALARDFLRMFYRKDRYLPFVQAVPIHLTPIFKKMATSREYAEDPYVKHWKQWANQTSMFLSDPNNRVRPILMPDISDPGRNLAFLLEFQASKILTHAVTQVVHDRVQPQEAARTAQQKAEKLVESLGFRKW